MKAQHTIKNFLILCSALNLVFASVAYSASPFPMTAPADDDEIVRYYSPYVMFVAEVAKSMDAAKAEKMVKLFNDLKKASPEEAAQFLKGLRLELIHGLELANVDLKKMKSTSPQVRRVVSRSLGNWVSELDESIFRNASKGIANKSE